MKKGVKIVFSGGDNPSAYLCWMLQSPKEVVHINSVKTVMCESDSTLTLSTLESNSNISNSKT